VVVPFVLAGVSHVVMRAATLSDFGRETRRVARATPFTDAELSAARAPGV
jgi:hypothetical protein